MNTRILDDTLTLRLAALLLLLAAGAALAQTPVDEDGRPIAEVYSDDEASVTLMSAADLQTLVGPIALYPDDLLAITLSASTFPLEIVQAARYLDELEDDSTLKADPEWDDSVVALLNYPEVVSMMSDDIDWTWQLGEAVVAQQKDVVAAIEQFRDRAYAAGNLASDDRQTVSRSDGDIIEIAPAEDDVIYVPYYEPEQVVTYQTTPVYHYYPRAHPVYYYPYPAGHHFTAGYFWGVTTAFQVGWRTNHLHVQHHSFRGHPYFGWNYYGNFWRRPSISVFNTYYGSHGYRDTGYRQRYGSYWRPRHHGGARPGHYRTRDRYYTQRRRSSSDDGYAREERRDQRRGQRRSATGDNTVLPAGRPVPARFRARQNRENNVRNRHGNRRSAARDSDAANRSRAARVANRRGNDRVEFRSRNVPATSANRRNNRRAVQPETPQRATVTRQNAAANRHVVRQNEDLRRRAGQRRTSSPVSRQRNTAPQRRTAAPARVTPARRPSTVRSAPAPARSAPSARSRSESRSPRNNRGARQSRPAQRSSSNSQQSAPRQSNSRRGARQRRNHN